MLAGIVGFVAILAIVIMIHEAGHYVMARRFGMKVEEFFLGFGPRIWSTRRGETEYGVKAILLGGYVKIAGMNPFAHVPKEDLPRTYGAKSARQRALVILAGPVTHFVMAFVALWVYLGIIGRPTAFAPVIAAVEPRIAGSESPARAAGLRPGDEVVAVDGRVMGAQSFIDYTRSHGGVGIRVTYERDGVRRTVTMVPVTSTVEGVTAPRFGVGLAPGRVLARDRPGPLAGLVDAGHEFVRITGLTVDGLGAAFGPDGIMSRFDALFGDAPRRQTDAISVAGVAKAAGTFADRGNLDALLLMFVQLNIVVGLINLLPLPPLDGGHLAVLAVEKVRGRPIDQKKLVPVSATVLALILFLSVPVLLLDFLKPLPIGP